MCHRVTEEGLEQNAIEFSRQARRVTTGNEAAETKRNGYRT